MGREGKHSGYELTVYIRVVHNAELHKEGPRG